MRTNLRSPKDRHMAVIDQQPWTSKEKRWARKAIGSVLNKDGEIDRRALTPQYRWNLCVERLTDGLFMDWDGFEFRSDWAVTFRGINGFETKVPKWDGTPVSHLVVLGEQGVGDEILFFSALPELLVRLGTKALEVQCYPKLMSIVERSFRVKVSERKTLGNVTEGDAVVALGDLFPFYRREVHHFPRKPYLKPDPDKVVFWKEWLNQFGNQPKIGIGYHSRHGNLDPESICTTEGAVYFDLQYEFDGKQENGLHKVPFDTRNDLENLFAFVAALDRVHSVTQTLVHVAGSQGKECHAVIPPKNGEVTFPLWYHACKVLGENDLSKSWPHLVYPSVTVYEDIDEFASSSP